MNWHQPLHLGIIAGLIITLVAGLPIDAGPGSGSPGPLPRGWGWLLASGIVSGVDPSARTATVAIAGQGRLETFEGGTSWRRQVVTGPQVVHVLPATVISDAGDEPQSLAAIHAGAPVTVWGVVRPDAAVLGLKVLMTPSSTRPLPPLVRTAGSYGMSGAVLHWSGGMLEVMTAQGARRSLIVTGATTVRNALGKAVTASAVAPYDVIKVDGIVNSDGSVAATRIDVDFAAAGASQVSGPVDQLFGDVVGLVVGGVMVPISPDCYFIRGSSPGTFKRLVLEQSVTVYGVPISTGSTPVGLRARVVVMR